jgi:geranylgeranyl pyrophosphate synthase
MDLGCGSERGAAEGSAAAVGAAAQDFVGRVEHSLSCELLGAGRLGEVAGPMVLARASKRARARVTGALAGSGEVSSALVDAAAAVELIHAASLLHDDVVDGARERRGLPTAHVLWGPQLAVLAGDLCLTLAMRRLARLGSEALQRAVLVVDTMTRGVADELLGRRDLSLDEAAWRRIADAKTGVLFGFAAWLPLHARGLGGAAEVADGALRHLGVAFQAADDASDFDRTAGETPLQDLMDGVPNHVVLSACRRDPSLREALGRAWNEAGSPAWAALAEAVVASGALADTRSLIAAEREAGERSLEALAGMIAPADRAGLSQLLNWGRALTASGPAWGAASRIAPRPADDNGRAPC